MVHSVAGWQRATGQVQVGTSRLAAERCGGGVDSRDHPGAPKDFICKPSTESCKDVEPW